MTLRSEKSSAFAASKPRHLSLQDPAPRSLIFAQREQKPADQRRPNHRTSKPYS